MSLRAVQRDFDKINDTLAMRREPMRDEIVINMLAGYRYLNQLLVENIGLLSRKGLSHFLELNHIVLCGADMCMRNDYLKQV